MDVLRRNTSRTALAIALVLGSAVAVAGPASADDCPDVELVFARGTGEPPGPGRVGQALADALTPLLGGRSLGTYGVSYPASVNFLTAATGADDARGHIGWMAANCPNTREVLGGFSQGASVVSMLAGVAPVGQRIGSIGSAPPLPPDLAGRIAAVAVFGNPGNRFGTPLSTAGMFAGRAIDLCAGGDPVCVNGGRDRAAHNIYEFPPFNEQAAGFVANFV